jgi:hypothetical protein
MIVLAGGLTWLPIFQLTLTTFLINIHIPIPNGNSVQQLACLWPSKWYSIDFIENSSNTSALHNLFLFRSVTFSLDSSR